MFIIDLWFIFVAVSLVFTTYTLHDIPIKWMQKLGWILIVAYTGPFGLLLYLLTCYNPSARNRNEYIIAAWRSAATTEIYSLAGNATGVMFAAIIVSYTTLSLSTGLIIEYITAFLVGWLLFQSVMMRSMYHLTLFTEAVSLNFVMIGMVPTMVVLMHYLENSRDPSSTQFWFTIGIATVAGYIIAYPVKYWLIKNKLKILSLPLRDQLKLAGLTFGCLVIITIITLLL